MSSLYLDSFEVESLEPPACQVCCELEEQPATKRIRANFMIEGSGFSAGFEIDVCNEHAEEAEQALREICHSGGDLPAPAGSGS